MSRLKWVFGRHTQDAGQRFSIVSLSIGCSVSAIKIPPCRAELLNRIIIHFLLNYFYITISGAETQSPYINFLRKRLSISTIIILITKGGADCCFPCLVPCKIPFVAADSRGKQKRWRGTAACRINGRYNFKLTNRHVADCHHVILWGGATYLLMYFTFPLSIRNTRSLFLYQP